MLAFGLRIESNVTIIHRTGKQVWETNVEISSVFKGTSLP